MPRITAKKKDYMLKDFHEWLIGQMRIQGVSQKDLAEKLNLTQPSVCQRIKKNNFDISDLIVIWHELGASEADILRFMKM